MRSSLRSALLPALLASAVHAAPLAEPSLSSGQDIRQETGEITVNGAPVAVVRYTWRDSQGDPRSVALVPGSPATSGYAVRMTHMVTDVGKRIAYIDADPGGDGGFGYFVSHEVFRNFTDATSGTIAAKHAEDDSPFGRGLPSTGTANSAGSAQAAHELRLSYPRWGTVASIPFPDGVSVSPLLADHQRFLLPVVIRWHFVAGQDYPLWTVDYDLTAAGDRIATDVRGPYGVMNFNEGFGPAVTALKWGDKYSFSADATPNDIGAAATPAGALPWSWNALNTGRRYHVLAADSYEFGLVDTMPFSASRYGDGFANRRGATSAGGSCGYGMQSLPCDWEWAYQSFQYNYAPSARPKLAWGSSPYLGSSTPEVYINGVDPPLPLSGKGHIRYGLHVVFGKSGPGAPRTLARAAAALEAAPTLGIAASPSNGGSVSYTVLGDTAGPYTVSGRTLAPWDSVRLVAAPAAGFAFSAWSGPCAGVSAPTCFITMDQARSVAATFTAAANPPRLFNLSTRMQVLTGNDVMIGGFIVGGSASKTVVVRARGPSLVPFGIVNALANPSLRLVRSSDQVTLAINDDWGSAANAAAVTASGFAPGNALESAILIALPPGAYTAIVSGVGGGTGVGIVEVFEVDLPGNPLTNISTRGRVLTGNDVMIGGFVINGTGPQSVVVRARGPSLVPFGIPDALGNPTLQLVRSSDQTTVAINDNWGNAANAAALSASGFAPANPLESAILISLDPGAYTAIVSGVGGATGVAIIEVFAQ